MGNAVIEAGVQIQTRKLRHLSSSSIYSIRRFVRGKQNCLIINPGYLSGELIKEMQFRKLYSFDVWDKFTSVHSLNDLLKDIESIILLDHTGNNKLSITELELINTLKLNGGSVYSIVSFYEHITGRIPLVYIAKNWVVNNDLFFVSKRRHLEQFKRILDIFICIVLVIPAVILICFGVLLVRLSSPGPFLFRQQRVGKNGKPFTLCKIRTMVHNEKGHTEFTKENDDRIFPIGKFLRKTKIDELPQLWNVLMGDMSLVGPRPEKVDIVEHFALENPYYNLRHTIRPGITGWAQVNKPTATPNENLQKLEYDLYYIKNMSYLLELRILWKTAKVVFTLDSL